MSDKKRVIVLDDLAPEGVDHLLGAGLAVEVGAGWAEAEVLRRVPGCHALVVGPGTPVTAAVLAAGADLKVVGRTGVGAGGIDVVEATRRGIVVVDAPDSALISEAEHALALVLACARDLTGADADLRAGRAASSRVPGDGVEVRGKTLGIAGAGPGFVPARRARPRARHDRARLRRGRGRRRRWTSSSRHACTPRPTSSSWRRRLPGRPRSAPPSWGSSKQAPAS